MATITQIEQFINALATRIANEIDAVRSEFIAGGGGGGGGIVDWSAITGKPTTFTPGVHTHAATDVTDFNAAVDTRIGTTAPAAHTHVAANVTDFNAAVDARIALVPPGAADWSTITNKPSTFTPSAHTHVAANITDIQSYVDGRIALAGSGTGNVFGPATSVVGHIALFNNTGGTLLSDAGAGFSANGLSLVSAANYAAMRTLLGAGVGDVAGPASVTDSRIALFDGTTGKLLKQSSAGFSANGLSLVSAADYAAMRTALGLVVGTDVQAYNAKLGTLAALTWAADKLPYFTSSSAIATTDLSSFIRGLLDDTTAVAARTTLDVIESYTVAVSDESTALTTGTAKITFRAPFACTHVAIPRANVNTASSSGLPTFDVNINGVSMLSTKLTIDASEKTSKTAAAPAVMSATSWDDDDEITVDVDTAGTGTKGAKLIFFLRRT